MRAWWHLVWWLRGCRCGLRCLRGLRGLRGLLLILGSLPLVLGPAEAPVHRREFKRRRNALRVAGERCCRDGSADALLPI
jgi:hypothetical protein